MVEFAFKQTLPEDISLSLGALVLNEHFKELEVGEVLLQSGFVVLFEGLQYGRHAQVLEFVFELLHECKWLKVKGVRNLLVRI